MSDRPNQTVPVRPDDRLKLLARENELLNSIVQGAADSIYAKDVDGRYISINQAGAEYFGRPIDEVIGKTDLELMDADVVKEFVRYDRQVLRSGDPVTYESRGTIGGSNRYFSTSKSALRDGAGNIIGLIGVSRDVTEARLSEEKYRFIFDNAPISFWEENFSKVNEFFDQLRLRKVVDLRTHFQQHPEDLDHCIDLIQVVNVNRTTLQMYGVDDKEAFISKIHRNFTPDSESIFAEEFTALYEGKTFFQSEGSFVNLNGNTVNVQFILNVLPGHEEDLGLVLVSIVDVTDTNQLASELNTIKLRYQSIVEAQTEMICRLNPQGKILFRNVAFGQFFRFKEGSSSLRFPLLFPPEEVERCQRQLESLTVSNDQTTFELRNYNKDGDMVWQEWSVTAFFGNNGTPLGFQAVGTDVTARKMAQDALAASEARWRSVFEHADDLIMTVNSEGYILSVNDFPELKDQPKWAGRTIDDVMLPENARGAMELISEVIATGRAKKTEFRFALSNGKGYATYGVALSPIFHGSRVLTVVCIARNITDTKEVEKQTREALIEGQERERMRVSQELHDGLGQLFTAIKFNVQHLRESLQTEETAATIESLNALENNIGMAISEVKNISRNLMPDVLWQFGLQPAIEDLVEKMRATTEVAISLELVELSARFSPEIEKALFRMCQELINNSIRHGHASNIYVQLINHGDSIVLMVEDDGMGFDVSLPSRGFGLRNIRSRAEVLEGVVDIDSNPGTGTVTTVEIPLKDETHDTSTDNGRP